MSSSIALCLLACVAAVGLAGLAGAVLRPVSLASSSAGDIPPEYVAAYRAAADRFALGDDGWSYLAAIGKIESDHGRSTAPGVLDGQNAHGCCAGPMQIHNGFGSGGATWGAYKLDGDGDGRTDIYDIDDAAAAAARYLEAAGAPADWRAAIYAYNHAQWYVDDVVAQAAEYRASALARASGMRVGPLTDDRWLAEIPGAPGERCDRRVVNDVVWLIRRYGLHLSDCFGGAPHAVAGEHPLGLAVDVSPADGDWSRTLQLAEDAGWSRSCAVAGCSGRGPFRVVLYNGYPGHGDPGFTDTPHLHLSWQHGAAAPFSPAPWVQVLRSGVVPR